MAHIAAVTGATVAVSAAAAAQAFVNGYLVLRPEEFLKLIREFDGKAVVLVVKEEGILKKRKVYIYAGSFGGLTALTKSYIH